ncbi:hypothetical protein AX15_001115 [Amanita polypyramis BW_CC]|nr:hypothetical protein AX15_001115 [Amanita polypyramis BW_CC]
MAPSATWTACPYVVRDGEVNPDVRTLNGPGAINSMSQAVVYNGVAHALTQSSEYSQNIVRFVETFFLNPETRMNPNMDYGQVVRGPGPNGCTGTFTGILDLRGMVKVSNSIMILRALNGSDWPRAKDETMKNWVSQYSSWLIASQIGKVAASRPNNHASFYVAQKAVLQLFIGDPNSATDSLDKFFKTTFSDQIARSGEQPFEATRTRPFHYRCFNLEALIVLAKIGDELDLDLWNAKSKYGATIQTAVDYTMSVDPRKEDITEIIPHVLAVAAAYGDPHGKYAAFLKRVGNYENKASWLYDQPEGVRRIRGRKEARSVEEVMGDIEFECPDVFSGVVRVELDDGVFVTCDELKPFYTATATVDTNKAML